MKKLLLPALALLLIPAFASGQNVQRCASYEYKQQELAADPSLANVLNQNEQDYQQFLQAHPTGYTNRAIVTIPVIFHVVYKTAAQNISTQRLLEQIDVLNKDYRKMNADIGNVPAAFQGLAADCEVEFCLAKRDPSGNWTDGIERTQTTVTSFGMSGDPVKFASTGGADAWDRNNYLNIWVCNLSGGLLGYSTFSGGPANKDGVVLLFSAVGVTGAAAPYNKGRTATHEVGHWFNLFHIWGDDTNADGVCNDGGSQCSGSDNVSDTPNQCDCHYGTFAVGSVQTDACTSTSPGTMWMNYMDYTDDAAMYFFTTGQKTRIWATLNGGRLPIMSSIACTPVGVADLTLKSVFTVAPSPSHGAFTLSFGPLQMENTDISVYNVLGEIVYAQHFDALNEGQLTLDLTGNKEGVYFIEVRNAHEKVTRKVIIN